MGTRYRPIISLITNEKISDASYANSIAGALHKNKFRSSETPMRMGTVSGNCNVSTASLKMMTETEKSSDLGKISEVR